MNNRAITIAIAAFFFASAAAWSQGGLLPGGKIPTAQSSGTYGGSYYNFGGTSGCDFLVSVWGFVYNPGRYNVPCETNLLDLLSYCGGPRDGAFLDRIRVIRRGDVDQQDEIAQVFEVDVQKYLELTQESTQATELRLFPRDLVILDGEEKSTVDLVLRVAQIIVAVATAATATIAIIEVTKKD